MAIKWDEVRYRGDASDVEELARTYRIDDYLDAVEENLKQVDQGVREKLMKEGIRLNERLSPRIYAIFNNVCRALELQIGAEVFCLPSDGINAFALLDVSQRGRHSLIGVTAGALERLEDDELKSILGHELGHVLFGNNRLMALRATGKDAGITVLPAFGESLFLRWLKKAEISADRASLLASRSATASATSLLKATFGLSARNLNLDIEALFGQIDEIKGHPELMSEEFASHPLLPIRLKALDLFSRSEKAQRNGFPAVVPRLLGDAELEDAVDELVRLTRRFPYKPVDQAVMRAVALAGALLLSADGDVSDDEVKILVQILHGWFTDEPESVIVTDRATIEAQLPEALAIIKKDGEAEHKGFVLSRLAEVALADGALMDAEGAVILDVARQLDMPQRAAYAIMVGAAQQVGFRTDAKLNKIASDLKQQLKVGLRA
jgi:Zn-dependent protease with chaperone function/uncharacterized tellurite resistance protein B-like protein